MTDQEMPPEGLMLAIANAHDDHFRWRVAAACIEVAAAVQIVERIQEDSDRQEWGEADVALANRAIWDWTNVGEVFARYLAIAHRVAPTISDDDLSKKIHAVWKSVAAGQPPRE